MIQAAKKEYWLNRIARMGIVDREYFEILSGKAFTSDRAAIRFSLENDGEAVLGLSLNPLIEKDWISAAFPETDASWYVLMLTRGDLFSTGPGFDAKAYTRQSSIPSARSTRRALKHFLAHATAETLMPMVTGARGHAMTWSEFRTQALASARQYVEQIHLRRPRTAMMWDETAEAEYIRSIQRQRVTSTHLVSVIMPTRDRAHSLEAAIQSVQRQTHENWELLVVDDGSTDDTVTLVRSMLRLDRRIRLIEQAGEGVSAARNRGLREASGEYLAFLDSDNTWRANFLDYSLKGMAARGLSATHSGVRLMRDGGEVRYRGIEGTRADLLYAGNFLDLNSVVVAKSAVDAVGGFDETIKRWVDYDLFLSLSPTVAPGYLPFLGVDYDDRTSPSRITGAELASWEDVVVGKHLIDWTALAGTEREAGLVSVIVPTYGDWTLTAAAVRSVLDNSAERAVEVIVIDNGSRRHVTAILRGLFGGDRHVRLERVPRNLNFALANNYALALSRGEFVIALNNDTVARPGWMEPLIEPLAANASLLGTQPLLLYPDGSVQTAGTVFLGAAILPRHFLSGHPIEEALAMPREDFSAVTAAALCMRASDLIRLHGFDPLYTNGLEDVDLCLRAARELPGRGFRVVLESIVYHYEGRTPDRSRAVNRNRTLFAERWFGALPPSDVWRYEALGITVNEV